MPSLQKNPALKMSAVSGKVRTKAPRLLARILLYAVLIDLAFLFLYPFLYILITSVKTNRDLLDITVQWIPRSLKWENFSMAIKACNFFSNLKNSAIYTIFGTAGHLLSCAFIGYGFARYRFPGRKLLFLAVLLSIIVPVQTIIIPLYLVYVNMGILGTYLPVILPTFFGFGLRGGLFIFIFRQFFMNLPRELENAAKVDGCGFLRTYVRIVLPIAKPAIVVTLVLSMVWHWNDFYEPGIYAAKPDMYTLPASIQALIPIMESPTRALSFFSSFDMPNQEAVINNAVFMAATLMAILPIILIFAVRQRGFMQGIERTGLVE